MFEVGDKVIYNGKGRYEYRNLSLDKTYSIYQITEFKIVYVKDDADIIMSYPMSIFTSLLEYRKLKIGKICSKLEKK